jgi:hypothetical protein
MSFDPPVFQNLRLYQFNISRCLYYTRNCTKSQYHFDFILDFCQANIRGVLPRLPVVYETCAGTAPKNVEYDGIFR